MNKQLYSSSLKKTPYKYSIAKKIAKLMLEKMDRNEIFDKCYNDNIVEITSKERRREVTNKIYERLLSLDEYLLKEFSDGDVCSSKFLLVYAIAKTDILFFEFMFEVYREALMNDRGYISVDDFDIFFKSKSEMDTRVNKWGHYTIEQLSKGYRAIIVDSGLGEREKRNIRVRKIMIHPAIEEHISLLGDKVYLQALLGE